MLCSMSAAVSSGSPAGRLFFCHTTFSCSGAPVTKPQAASGLASTKGM